MVRLRRRSPVPPLAGVLAGAVLVGAAFWMSRIAVRALAQLRAQAEGETTPKPPPWRQRFFRGTLVQKPAMA